MLLFDYSCFLLDGSTLNVLVNFHSLVRVEILFLYSFVSTDSFAVLTQLFVNLTCLNQVDWA